MVGRLIELALMGQQPNPAPLSDELSVKIDKGDFLLDKLGAGRPNCARETGMSCNEKIWKEGFRWASPKLSPP
jgi:hypothetical protein